MTCGASRPPPNSCMLTKSPPCSTRSGLKARGLGDDRGEARDVARMRAGMEIRQERDAQRPCCPRPSGDRQIEAAREMRLRARNPLEPALAAFLVAIGRPQRGPQQPFASGAGGSRCASVAGSTGRRPARQRRSSISPAGTVASTGVVGSPAASSSSRDPVIADPEDAERAVRRIEQARSVQAAAEIRQDAGLAAARSWRRAWPAAASKPFVDSGTRTRSADEKTCAGSRARPTTCSTDALPGREQRAQRERGSSGAPIVGTEPVELPIAPAELHATS